MSLLQRLVQKRRLILIAVFAIFLTLWTLSLIFADYEDKVFDLIFFWVVFVLVFLFMKCNWRLIGIYGRLKFMIFGEYFFFFSGVILLITNIRWFISDFPNGLNPIYGSVLGMIVGALDNMKKANDKLEKEERDKEDQCE